MVPSGFIISMSTPPGSMPAILVRSTTASVCPGRRSTPLSCAMRGNMCPGRPSSSGLVAGSTNARNVLVRSDTDMPVVHPLVSRSTDTVKGVECNDVFSPTMRSSLSCWHLSRVSGAHSRPRPYWVMKFIISSVTVAAAAMKSPSFSRSSSSTTMTIRPAFISSIASSMVLSDLSVVFISYVVYFLLSVCFLPNSFSIPLLIFFNIASYASLSNSCESVVDL